MASSQTCRWRKSSVSGGNGGECVELAHTGDQIRDSKNPAIVLCGDAAALLDALKSGRLG